MKILLVDDHHDSARLLKRQLSAVGYETVEASNGLEALDVIAQQYPDLIISDIMMPGMDGFQLCSALKQDPIFRTIPFIFYTVAYTDPQDEQFALSIGASRFLIRPLSSTELMNVIEEVIHEEEPVTEEHPKMVDYLRKYSERVVAKLESTVKELEVANQRLQHEIAETRRLQEQVRRSERLAAIGELAAVVAHEVRNPLGAIGNCVAVLKKRAGLSGTYAELLDIIAEEAGRLDTLVENLLAFARPEPLSCKQTDLRALIDSVLVVMEKGTQIPDTINLESLYPAFLPFVNVDPDQIRQVFLNLIANAIHAMPRGGTLTITTQHHPTSGAGERGSRGAGEQRSSLPLPPSPPLPSTHWVDPPPSLSPSAGTEGGGEWVEVVVADTGAGMTEEVIRRCFEPFYTTKAKGSGLGLAIVRRIVEAHNGQIELTSIIGKGTQVCVMLPVNCYN